MGMSVACANVARIRVFEAYTAEDFVRLCGVRFSYCQQESSVCSNFDYDANIERSRKLVGVWNCALVQAACDARMQVNFKTCKGLLFNGETKFLFADSGIRKVEKMMTNDGIIS